MRLRSEDGSLRVWSTTDPLENKVVLCKDTLEKHIVGDHSAEDAEMRRRLAISAKDVVTDPAYIIEQYGVADPDTDVRRYDYVSLVVEDEDPMIVHVVADTDREPYEVATIFPAKKIKSSEKGAVIYVRSTGNAEEDADGQGG